jgi:hypothetical protein
MGQACIGIPGLGASLEAQLDGVASAQLRIRRAVETDEVDDLDELVAEKGARLEALLGRLLRQPRTAPEVFSRLSLLLEADEQLAALIERRLMVLRNELRRSSEAALLVQTYAKSLPALPGPEQAQLGNLSA